MGQPAVSAAILAGGASSRMGFNKAFARLGEGGRQRTIIERTVAVVRLLALDVMVVATDQESYQGLGVRTVVDAHPGCASLGGIYSALLVAQHYHCLVVACDMPFLSLPLWRHMLALPRDYDVLMPRVGGYLEPLHAVYSKGCIEPITRLLDRGERRILALLDQVDVRHVVESEVKRFDPEQRSFFNVNTPEDLLRAAAILRDESSE